MLFNSFEFAVFFLVFAGVFFTVPRRVQPVALLIGSYVFYMGWRPSYALLLLFTTVVDYTTARIMQATPRQGLRRAAMIGALTINIGILAALKYLDFILTNILNLAHPQPHQAIAHVVDFVLPVGISFYTFQSIGYTLDVYFRRTPAEKSFLTYAQYVSFFPQLVAGPIERAGHMLPQFKRPHFLKFENLSEGLWLIGYGLFKKMCIADVASPFVGSVSANPAAFAGVYNLLATLLFALQIYCDFSGYSTIARGVARILDFDLMVNFRQPYFSTSLGEFWRRWHISLSTWFRDYLYLPLGGSRVGPAAWGRNILIVFLVSGLWHGAAWTFVIWGGLHGVGLIVERVLSRIPSGANGRFKPVLSVVGWGWTMAVVLAGWVFFRAPSLSQAFSVFASLRRMGSLSYGVLKIAGLPGFQFLSLACAVALMLAVDWLVYRRPRAFDALVPRLWLRTSAGVALLYMILLFGVFGRMSFIYFQF
jgi:alginate O-acetyltransferase complex protein AlgI